MLKLWLTSAMSEKLIFVRCAKSKAAEADRNMGFLNLSVSSNMLYSDDVIAVCNYVGEAAFLGPNQKFENPLL